MLIDFLPPFMREVKEISEIMAAENSEFEEVNRAAGRSLDNSFAAFADSAALERWEGLFGIKAHPDDSEEKRREEVLVRLFDKLPYTYRTLDQALTVFYGDNGIKRHFFLIESWRYTVTVGLDLSLEDALPSIERFLRQRMPANMDFILMVIYSRQKKIQEYTHGWLNTHTHLKLRRGDFS